MHVEAGSQNAHTPMTIYYPLESTSLPSHENPYPPLVFPWPLMMLTKASPRSWDSAAMTTTVNNSPGVNPDLHLHSTKQSKLENNSCDLLYTHLGGGALHLIATMGKCSKHPSSGIPWELHPHHYISLVGNHVYLCALRAISLSSCSHLL